MENFFSLLGKEIFKNLYTVQRFSIPEAPIMIAFLFPVDGNWGGWGAWSACERLCKDAHGKATASRLCNSPVPKRGGRTCEGSATKEKTCSTQDCNGGYNI